MKFQVFLILCSLCLGAAASAQTPSSPAGAESTEQQPAAVSQLPDPATPAPSAAPQPITPEEKRRRAEEQLKQQEHQRILGIMPEFNTSNISDAVPLTPKQKFSLALKSALDPATVAFSAIDGAVGQWDDSYPGYGQGTEGYFKRFGAAYADSFDGTIIGNALFPSLLHQDPRYFRKGTGTVGSRLLYSVSTTIICKGDNGHWQPNYSNVLGNFAAGGISNLYYPASDRGAELTAERALTVTAEGALGALFYEFWPDISHKLFKKNH